MMPKPVQTLEVAIIKTVPMGDAIQMLRDRLRKEIGEQKTKPPEFQQGDIVRLDTGALGIVIDYDGGSPNVFYFDEDGWISGPAFGFELTKVEI